MDPSASGALGSLCFYANTMLPVLSIMHVIFLQLKFSVERSTVQVKRCPHTTFTLSE